MYALIGRTLGYSHSPAIHEAFGRYRYRLCPIPPEALADTLRDTGWRGFNVTIPYKQAVIPYLSRLDDAARQIGAVNTVVREADGSLTGYNTDLSGFLALADRAGVDFAGRKVVILGSGGASRMAQFAVRQRGARQVVVVSRSGGDNYRNLDRHRDAGILVNATPVGTFPNVREAPVSPDAFPRLEGVLDLIYNPLRTRLVLEAQKRGIPAMGGLSMLVAQAARACELFTGAPLDADGVERVYRRVLKSVGGIALIGMPGSGKTEIGRRVAEALSMPFVDVDREIEARAGMTIPEIFEARGEAGFRDLESAALDGLTRRGGQVLSSGGGAVLREENRDALRRNALVVRLTRDVERLPTDGRPLSRDPETLRAMAAQREPFYRAAEDARVSNDGAPGDTCRQIVELFMERRL